VADDIENVIYAFAMDDAVGYIGITGGRLTSRLRVRNGYSDLVFREINRALGEDKTVWILYFKPEPQRYRDIDIDMGRGLEIPLQKKFKSQWTTQGYGGYGRIIDPIVQEIMAGLD